ncbi:MAG: AraC family transcriptional regulator [Marinobacter sp.]|uniref:AraC family transcriptional regulator n=1 Tax=Marinobacter sp. TaxID=50741 RepID=UPI00299CFA68|nr:AraC family transcriptional regulator [Marinobacter sp.]MDX1757094.1 AraC family transcriptional regulator [Marinobacter sp.]
MTRSPHPSAGVLSVEYARLICQAFANQGGDADQLLQGTGLTIRTLQDLQGTLSLQVTKQLLTNYRQRDGRDDLGVRLGAALNIGSHGFLGYAFQSSQTLGQAFDLAIRYLRTRTSLYELQLEHQGDGTRLVLEERYPLGELSALVADALVTSILSIGSHILTFLPALDVQLRFPFPERPHHRYWSQINGIQVTFDCAEISFLFPTSWLASPLPTADPQLAALAAARCEAELAQAKQEDDLVLLVRQKIRRHLASPDAMAQVAAELCMTTRTLRRKLYQAGTHYNALVDELRHRLAVDWLLHSPATVEQIAADLGYSDPSNFSRAVRRWTGESPRRFRQKQARRP